MPESGDGAWLFSPFIAGVSPPGAQGATLDEARENLREAVELVIEANRQINVQQG